jgi:hypothetical protein
MTDCAIPAHDKRDRKSKGPPAGGPFCYHACVSIPIPRYASLCTRRLEQVDAFRNLERVGNGRIGVFPY